MCSNVALMERICMFVRACVCVCVCMYVCVCGGDGGEGAKRGTVSLQSEGGSGYTLHCRDCTAETALQETVTRPCRLGKAYAGGWVRGI